MLPLLPILAAQVNSDVHRASVISFFPQLVCFEAWVTRAHTQRVYGEDVSRAKTPNVCMAVPIPAILVSSTVIQEGRGRI